MEEEEEEEEEEEDEQEEVHAGESEDKVAHVLVGVLRLAGRGWRRTKCVFLVSC